MNRRGKARRPFSVVRFVVVVVLLMLVAGFVAGYLLTKGFLGGYFSGVPIVVIFYTVLTLVAGILSRRLLRQQSFHMQRWLMFISLGRIMLILLFTILGLFLWPLHHWGFVVLSGVCYVVTMIMSSLAVIRS